MYFAIPSYCLPSENFSFFSAGWVNGQSKLLCGIWICINWTFKFMGDESFSLWFFLVFYVGIILGNLFIVFTVIIDSHLHSPMYFLLANLSLLDLGLSSTTVPKMISDLLTNCNVISFPKCMTQIFFIHVMGGVEMVLLIAMAYDRYTAICKPLHYLSVMIRKMCFFCSGCLDGGNSPCCISVCFCHKLAFLWA